MILVIGGGITGLTLAYELQQRGIPYLLVEASEHAGGYIGTLKIGQYQIEQGPNSYLLNADTIQWLHSLGLEQEILPANAVSKARYIWRNGAYAALPQHPAKLLTSGFFSWGTKWRILKEVFRKQGSAVPKNMTLAQLLEERLGKELVQYVADPFVAGIYAGSAHELLVHQAFPSLAKAAAEGSMITGMMKAGAGGRRQSLTFKSGMDVLPRTLAQNIKHTLTGTVMNLTPESEGGYVAEINTPTGMEQLSCSEVVICTPAFKAADLVRGINATVASALDQINYPPMVGVHIVWQRSAMAKPPVGFGGLHPAVEGRFTLGNIWTSSTFSGRCPEDEVMITAFVGGTTGAQNTLLSDVDIVARVLAEQRQDYGIAGTVQPAFTHTKRWQRAIPQYDVHQQEAERAVQEAALPNLHFLSNWMGGISLSDCIQKARTWAAAQQSA